VFVKRKKFKDLFTKASSPALATGAPRGSSRLARTKFVFGLQVLVPEMFYLQEVVPICNLSARCGTKSVISSFMLLAAAGELLRGGLAAEAYGCALFIT
jgi:hypothetical protein